MHSEFEHKRRAILAENILGGGVLLFLILLSTITIVMAQPDYTISYDNTQILENNYYWVNVTFDWTPIDVRFYYNNTLQSTSQANYQQAPRMTEDANITFYWEYDAYNHPEFYYPFGVDLLSYYNMDYNKTSSQTGTVKEISQIEVYDDFEDASIDTDKWGGWDTETGGYIQIQEIEGGGSDAGYTIEELEDKQLLIVNATVSQSGNVYRTISASSSNHSESDLTTIKNEPNTGIYGFFRDGTDIYLIEYGTETITKIDASGTGNDIFIVFRFQVGGGGTYATIRLYDSWKANYTSYTDFEFNVWKDYNNNFERLDGTLNGYTFNNGQLNNDTTINSTYGKYGKGAGFDGDGDYLNLTNILNFNTSFTISLWTNLDFENGGDSNIIGKVSSLTSASGGWVISPNSGDNRIQVFLFDGSAPSPVFTTTNPLPYNEWVHLVMSWNGTNESGSIKVYFNGVKQEGTEANYGTYPIFNNADLLIGKVVNSYINGSIDSIKIWNRSLSAEEVAIDYNTARKYVNSSLGDKLIFQMAFENSNSTHTFDENELRAGKHEQAIGFDGDGDYINVNNNFADTDDITFCGWAYPNSLTSPTEQYYINENDGNSIIFKTNNNGVMQVYLGDTTSPGYHYDSTNPLVANTWNHFCVIYNSTDLLWCLDGSCNEMNVGGSTTGDINFDTTLILGNRDDGAKSFNGSIDDVMIFNRSLTETEIGYLYNHTYHGNTTFNNQSVYHFELDNCSELTNPAFNITSKDEQTNNLIVTNASHQITYFHESDPTYIKEYVTTYYNRNNHGFCKYPEWVNLTDEIQSTFTKDGYNTIQFFRTGTELTGIFTAYLLETALDVAQITYTITGSTFDRIEGALVRIYRTIGGVRTKIYEKETDVAGQVVPYQDQTYTYYYEINATVYPFKTFNLQPADTAYTIKLTVGNESYFENPYEGIRYKHVPDQYIFNVSGEWVNLSFILEGSNPEEVGMRFTGENLSCLPANCEDIIYAENGGQVTVAIRMNATGNFYGAYWFKPDGEERIYVNDRVLKRTSFIDEAGKALTEILDDIKDNTSVNFRTILAAAISCAVIGLGASLGLFGALLIVPAVLANIVLSLPAVGLINPLVGMIMSIFGVVMFVLFSMGRNI